MFSHLWQINSFKQDLNLQWYFFFLILDSLWESNSLFCVLSWLTTLMCVTQLSDLYNNDAIFDKFGCCVSGDGLHFATGSYRFVFLTWSGSYEHIWNLSCPYSFLCSGCQTRAAMIICIFWLSNQLRIFSYGGIEEGTTIEASKNPSR